MRHQAKMHTNEPTNAEIRSSNVILISPRPKSIWNSRNKNPPTSAPSIPTPMLTQSPKPRLVKVMRRAASVPASAPMISQTIISPIEKDIIQSFLLTIMFISGGGSLEQESLFPKSRSAALDQKCWRATDQRNTTTALSKVPTCARDGNQLQ